MPANVLAAPGVAYLNDAADDFLVTEERQRRKNAKKNDCVVMYYRAPKIDALGRPFHSPGFIQWHDANEDSGKDYLYLGFIVLSQYGRVWDEDSDFNGKHIRIYGNWAPILVRDGGTSEFPLAQVISNRWYDKKNLPISMETGTPLDGQPCEACGAIHHIRFPQLQQYLQGTDAEGKKNSIPLFHCPDCNDITFHKAVHLARHLRNRHNYEIRDLELLSKKTGIDFDREYRDKMTSQIVAEVVADVEDEITGAVIEPEDISGMFEHVAIPTRSEAVSLPDVKPAPKEGDRGPFGKVYHDGKWTQPAKKVKAA